MLTVADLMTHLAIQLDSPLAGMLEAKVRTAVLAGWAEMMAAKQWSYFHKISSQRIEIAQDDGTVDFDYDTRVVTLTDNTWPADVTLHHIRIAYNWFPIYRRLSDTTIELYEGNCPEGDKTDEPYVLQQALYPLPYDVGDIVQVLEGKQNIRMMRLNYLETHQIFEGFAWSLAMPTAYTLVSDFRSPDRWSIWIPTQISQTSILQYLYVSRVPLNPLVRESRGLVSVDSGVATFDTAVVTDNWEGCVLRVGTSDTSQPTGVFGDIPGNDIVYDQAMTEVRVLKPLTSTTCRISSSTLSATDVAYVASAHVDVADGAMQAFLLRCCESQYGTRMVGNHAEALVSKAKKAEAFHAAAAADARIVRTKGPAGQWYGLRLKDIGYVPNNQ